MAVALGLIPVGTANDLALNLGVPTDIRVACEILRQGRIKSIDIARAGEQIYICIAGAGFDSEVTRLANQESVWLRGKAVYLNAILRTLSKFKPKRVEISYDDGHFAGDVMFIAVGNTASYGGGLRIVPQAKLDDGLLDICIVKKTSRFQLLLNLPLLYRGWHVHHPAVEIHQARRVTISSPDRLELFGDGEYLQNIPVTIEVIPQALRVIVRQ
jgi:diacylglycerol kinase (ATP)